MRSIGYGPVQIGKLGVIHLDDGVYVYVGSAFGSGGLSARVRRHLSGGAKLHWHIDYLLRTVRVCEVWYTLDPVKREEAWVEWFRNAAEATNPLPRFGSGDCGCDGHLFRFEESPEFERFQKHAEYDVSRIQGDDLS